MYSPLCRFWTRLKFMVPQVKDNGMVEALVLNSPHALVRGLEQLTERVERIMERYPLPACEAHHGQRHCDTAMHEMPTNVSNEVLQIAG
jgi:hypothetical protein